MVPNFLSLHLVREKGGKERGQEGEKGGKRERVRESTLLEFQFPSHV